MNETLFNQFEMLEQVPTDLMTEVTKQPNGSVLNMADHTKLTTAETIAPTMAETPKISPFAEQAASNANFASQPQQGQQIKAGNLITGQMAVTLLDLILPVACVLLIEKINGRKINKKWLQATADEKKILEPALQNYLNSINFNVESPLNALLITVAMIYGTKTIEVMNTAQSAAPPPQMPQPFQQQQRQKSSLTETRGRHKKDCQCNNCKQKRQNR